MDYKNDELIAKKMQKAQLRILKETDRVCKLLNINYALSMGTCLGAVRHKGFIPWDDDIDLCMRYSDLKKLQENALLFDSDYFIQCRETDPEYGLMITRVRDNTTTLVESSEVDRDINHGIFIDIYPLYNIHPKGFALKKKVFSSMLCRLFQYRRVPRNRGKLMKAGSYILLHIVPLNMQKKIVNWCYGYICSQGETGYLSYLYGNYPDTVFPENIFFPTSMGMFENIQVPIPARVNEYLSICYEDYMKLPPVESRKFHHEFAYIDFNKSYKNFKGKYYCVGGKI